MITAEEKSQGEALAQHIAAALKDHPSAEVRVQLTGMESVAWFEAYQYLQQFAPQRQVAAPTKDAAA